MWGTYAGTGAGTLAFVAARLLVAPLGAMDPELRALRGRVLSVGSGYGVVERYLVDINPDVTVEGVERDPRRVAVVARTGARAPGLTVRAGDALELESGDFDAALAVDLLHHLPAERQAPALAALARTLRPGGVCLVKEIATTPRWKYAWNRLHDLLAAGRDPIFCRAPDDMARLCREQGFNVRDVRRLGRATPYPHYLLVLSR